MLIAIIGVFFVAEAGAQVASHGEGRSWLRDSQIVLKGYLGYMEPLDRASLAATRYLNGEIDENDARYYLTIAREEVDMIDHNLKWQIDMMRPVPAQPEKTSRQLVHFLSNLPERAQAMRNASMQVIDLYETFVDGSVLGYEAGTRQYLLALDEVESLAKPYYDISLLDYEKDDELNRSSIEIQKADDVCYFAVMRLYYSLLLFDRADSADAMSAVADAVSDMEMEIEAGMKSAQEFKAFLESPDGKRRYDREMQLKMTNDQLASYEKESRVAKAYHKVLVAADVADTDPGLVASASSELFNAKQATLPDWERARKQLRARGGEAEAKAPSQSLHGDPVQSLPSEEHGSTEL
ncbi:hypothetical protein [Hyphomonas chukchiensis]|nr:hypothetical protein [Hyphomonas chukchiensis]